MIYVVIAPLVIVRDETGASHHLYQGAPVPDGVDKDHLKQLVDGEMVEKVKASDPSSDGSSPDTVEAILSDVGDDQAKAAAALEAENAKDKPRSTLVSKLEAIANPQA